MSLSAPAPPDPTSTANAQQGYNAQAAQQGQQMSMIGQSNPYGSMTYKRVGTYADGTPKYAATTTLSAAQQGLLDKQQQTQGAAGATAGDLVSQLRGQYAAGPNTDQSAIVKQLLGWQTDYMKPTFTQQQSNLDSKLAAQGITQGSEAYDNAQRELTRTQSGVVEKAMADTQQQAFDQSISSYLTPIQAELAGFGSMFGSAAPASVKDNLINTPQANVAPADYSGLAESNYAAQNANYQNTLSGLFAIPSALLGGWARGGGLAGIAGK